MATTAATPRPKVEEYEASDAMRTLQRAEEIKGNPTLHAAAQRHAKKQMRALKSIASTKPMAKRTKKSASIAKPAMKY